MVARDRDLPIGDDLTLNVILVCCLRIRPRSPLTPLRKGGTGNDRSPPTIGGMRGGSRLGCEGEIQRFSVLSCHQWPEPGNVDPEEEPREY
jgi:hypothetical protein